MQRKINLVVQPSFKCNYYCEFCYLGDLKKKKDLLDIKTLSQRISELQSKADISSVQILGGEPSLLDREYFNDMCSVLKGYHLSFVTNFSNEWLLEYCLMTGSHLTVSLDTERKQFKNTVSKLKKCKGIKCISLSSIVFDELYISDKNDILDFYEDLGFDVFFVQFSGSTNNNLLCTSVDNSDYCEFIKELIEVYKAGHYTFKLENMYMFDTENANMHSVYINPDGSVATISYTKYGEEGFINFNNIDDLFAYMDSKDYNRMKQCEGCKLYFKCKGKNVLSEKQNKCLLLNEMKDSIL